MYKPSYELRTNLADVALGKMTDPKITITINGKDMVLDGTQAKAFALGFLVAAKSYDGTIIEGQVNIKAE